MLISGKVLVALADFFEDHFEYSTWGTGGVDHRTIVRTDELRDLLIEGEFPKHVVDWAQKIPKQHGQIKEHLLTCGEQSALVLRLAEAILSRPTPPGRHVDKRKKAKLIEALDAEGFLFHGATLVATNDVAERVLAVAHVFRRGLVPSTPPAPTTTSTVKPAQRIILSPRQAMARTVGLAKKCVDEKPDRPSPKVAVLVTAEDGTLLGEAHRGELKPGEHAEYTLLQRMLKDETLAGSIVYTTLEPCTTRGEGKIPCAERLHERRVKRVVMGMVDPDPRIRGVGQRYLQARRIEVGMYDLEFTDILEELNRDFTRQFKDKE